MSAEHDSEHREEPARSDAGNWARDAGFTVGSLPPAALNLNVDGRHVVGPLQGFGQLWRKTHVIRLVGTDANPVEVIRVWKERFPEFQPPANRFYPSVAGVEPGEVVVINASVSGILLSTGVKVLYADDESFTLMTPEGHPESGWITFSARSEADGVVLAEVQSYARASDPIYEFGFRFLGGSRFQDRLWAHVLRSVAVAFGAQGEVVCVRERLDRRVQWRQAKNVWQNAGIRTGLYKSTAPARWLRHLVTRG